MTSKERDNAFEPLVRMGLQSGPVRRGAECADAALIAAFVDRKLTLAERSRWESHFAGCGYCAAVLGATTRVWLELPQAETSHARWWAIPLTGTIAAAALAALFLHLQALNQTMPSPAIVAESARTDELASAEKRQSARTPERAQVEASAPQALALNQPLAPDENALPSAPTAARPREHHRTEPMGEVARESATGRADSSSGDAVRSAARAPREPAERAESYAAPQAGITPTGAGHNAIVGAAVGQAGAGAAIGGALGSGAISLSQSAATESKSGSNPANGAGWAAGFWSADHRVKWAVGANGAIARFTLVSSWTLQSSGVANDLLAGSAPSTNVCWVVGRDGVILRTTDGEHWGKLQSPVKVDFAAVAAESATAAIVTARDGHRFTTNDGGGSWHPL